jgi:hypothetical protein
MTTSAPVYGIHFVKLGTDPMSQAGFDLFELMVQMELLKASAALCVIRFMQTSSKRTRSWISRADAEFRKVTRAGILNASAVLMGTRNLRHLGVVATTSLTMGGTTNISVNKTATHEFPKKRPGI